MASANDADAADDEGRGARERQMIIRLGQATQRAGSARLSYGPQSVVKVGVGAKLKLTRETTTFLRRSDISLRLRFQLARCQRRRHRLRPARKALESRSCRQRERRPRLRRHERSQEESRKLSSVALDTNEASARPGRRREPRLAAKEEGFEGARQEEEAATQGERRRMTDISSSGS